MAKKAAGKEKVEKWAEVIVSAPLQLLDPLSNFLTEIGAKGVFQEDTVDASAPKDLEEPADREDLKAYFPMGPAFEKKLASLKKYIDSLSALFPDLEKPTIETQLISDSDWGEQWKKYFKPIRLTKNIVVKPTWERYAPLHRDIVVEIDPGMAFGTGQHPSTRMCLEAIEDILLTDRAVKKWQVLDVGTGTGILGISCAKLGADSVVGVDIDPKAVEIARQNAAINGVGDKVKIAARDVRKVKGVFDLIVANLTAETLLKLKPHLVSLTAPGGYLVISGIIEQNGKKVEDAFLAEDMILQRAIREKEWVCYVLKKRMGLN